MNKRRVAVGIAVVLPIFSGISTTISRKNESKRAWSCTCELHRVEPVNPQEKVEEAGSSSKKKDCSKLVVEGTIIDDGTSGLFFNWRYNHESLCMQPIAAN